MPAFRRASSKNEDEAYTEGVSKTKRQKGNSGRVIVPSPNMRVTRASMSLDGLLDLFQTGIESRTSDDPANDLEEASYFERFVGSVLPECLEVRCRVQDSDCRTDSFGTLLRPLSRYEVSAAIKYASAFGAAALPSPAHAAILRKLQLHRERRRTDIQGLDFVNHNSLTSVPPQLPPQPPQSGILNSLTIYSNDALRNVFLITPISPWMELMTDVREHYSYAHPTSPQSLEVPVPIRYVSLQPSHLQQVHELLARVFWDGINVSDLLQSSERCSVIAMYGKTVIGAALLSSPQETYITYLAVRAGWHNCQIATTMLYHLIMLNPHRDITLHVAANNPAMLLYNRFGFKAEEFITGFYEDYLDSQSRASMNAFRLRLRR
ncbi:uncharacterized protein F5891DRAFT_1190666 [Suillus fuscotomentosus]|uniref:N-acetyltransferase domain-containing protein n=1 Tax=Suillus fuscotomentosus TaxID=1912939 RepID=A0AAD4HJ75_9AGAM|nr:uncharacterized protein F5891DRAFT_1190666 [Suillus fuscotomentosus]KAG1898588.1 hypothetical protein F5891DRAFT_1190666 [Suillus fuscotomentosus]